GLGLEFKTHVWVPSSVEEEWEELGGHMHMVVVLELYIWEEFIPVILTLVAEKVEVLLQLLIHALHLAIGLQVVGSGGVELHSEQLVELLGELHYKLQHLVGDISLREAIEFPDIPLVQVCSTHGGAGGVGQNEVCLLAKQVHHHHNCIVTMAVEEFHNEVHGHYAPLFC
ncbi:hypothetical protein J132_00612, partial [Termitomyces sp. J132]